MELFNTILNLIISFFQHRTDSNIAKVTEETVVQTIRANTNAQVVKQQVETQEELVNVEAKQTIAQVERKKKTIKDQVNDTFGKDK